MSSDAQLNLDAKVLAQFASEIKRLANEGHKSIKKGNELAALSSFSAMVPLIKSVTQGLFESVVQDSESEPIVCTSESAKLGNPNGYL
jgi:hypothetical protein